MPLPAGEVVSPLLEQPYTRPDQSRVGAPARPLETAISADYVRVDGRDLNLRLRPNVIVNGQRFLAGVGVFPNNQNFRTARQQGVQPLRRSDHWRCGVACPTAST